MLFFMVAAGCGAAAVLHLVRLARPPRTDLLTAVGRWENARARATRVQQLGAPADDTWSGRAGTWLADQLRRRARDLTGLSQDLAITGTTLEAHLTRVLTLGFAGLLGPSAVLAVMNAAGLGVPPPWGLAAGLGLAALMVALVQRELREGARVRRGDFRRGLSIYLDLVAMSMQAGRGHAEALPASAHIASGWPFTDLQDAIDGARFSGTTAWAALGDLGRRVGLRELSDLDAALQLANDDGAKVRATLVARAETLREQRLADAEANAAQATESMKFALIVMVFAFLAYELYPSVARLMAG